MRSCVPFILILLCASQAWTAPHIESPKPQIGLPQETGFRSQKIELADSTESPLVFDIPISYNREVRKWISFFQTKGRKWFATWLARSHNVLPQIQTTFQREGLPRDLAYMAMIESGFSSHAVSGASAVGPWQFIKPTGERYGLKITWWLDERRDFDKSTKAAAKYIKQLYGMFGSWYLVAAAYNTGESRVKNTVNRYKTKNFWELVEKGAFVEETENYIPKLLAATLISKAPSLYGFRDVHYVEPPKYDVFSVPGGTRLDEVADALGVTPAYMKQLNPELLAGYVPPNVSQHRIRIPKGAIPKMSQHVRNHLAVQ
jgi:membrane-bound lytic murein transglycosylase D